MKVRIALVVLALALSLMFPKLAASTMGLILFVCLLLLMLSPILRFIVGGQKPRA